MRIHTQSLMKNGKGNWIPVLECYYVRVPYDFVHIIEIHRQYYISVNLLFFLDKNAEVGRQKSIHHILCGWLALFPIQEDKWPLFSKSNFPPFLCYIFFKFSAHTSPCYIIELSCSNWSGSRPALYTNECWCLDIKPPPPPRPLAAKGHKLFPSNWCLDCPNATKSYSITGSLSLSISMAGKRLKSWRMGREPKEEEGGFALRKKPGNKSRRWHCKDGNIIYKLKMHRRRRGEEVNK